jgi:hypothetical protein
MSLDWCIECQSYHWNGEKCYPKWYVWCEYYGEEFEDADIIYARDKESAIEKWAEQSDSDSADYTIVSGTEVSVFICSYDNEKEINKYIVSGEAIPSYTARKIG